MLKNNTMHNHLKLRAACSKLRCAINDNPDFFASLEIPKSVARPVPKTKSFHEIGLAGMMVIVLSKMLGWH